MTFHDPGQDPAAEQRDPDTPTSSPDELEPPPPTHATDSVPPYVRTRLRGVWAVLAAGIAMLVVLIVFVLENSQRVTISFFGAHGHLDEGIALLISAAIGAFVVVFAETARILQLRARARRTARSRRRRWRSRHTG
jgi:uncharacterized integral membrane protein